jgi:hypothetical protein
VSETTIGKVKRKTSADYETIADRLLADMQLLEVRMQTDRIEIDRLRLETRVLQEESSMLENETRATLSRLKLAFI